MVALAIRKLKPVKYDEINKAFEKLKSTFSQKIKRLLIVETKDQSRKNITELLSDDGIEIVAVAEIQDAITEIEKASFDCLVVNLNLADAATGEFLQKLSDDKFASFPPVILYAENSFSPQQAESLRQLSKSIVIKGANSPEGLVDEMALILHRVESKMSLKQRKMIKTVRNREHNFKGIKILLVDDDIRNIFALTSVLEQKGATVLIGRNGHEALDRLNEDPQIDLVLMDIMMPEMDGYEATRRIRKQSRFANLPIIAVTAKAMKDDHKKCLEAGTTDYVSKPVDLEKLMSLIRVWAPQLEKQI